MSCKGGVSLQIFSQLFSWLEKKKQNLIVVTMLDKMGASLKAFFSTWAQHSSSRGTACLAFGRFSELREHGQLRYRQCTTYRSICASDLDYSWQVRQFGLVDHSWSCTPANLTGTYQRSKNLGAYEECSIKLRITQWTMGRKMIGVTLRDEKSGSGNRRGLGYYSWNQEAEIWM